MEAWTYNPHLLGDEWMKNIIWDSDQNSSPPFVLWDLNDPHMQFQLQEGASMLIAANAAATVLPHAARVSTFTSWFVFRPNVQSFKQSLKRTAPENRASVFVISIKN